MNKIKEKTLGKILTAIGLIGMFIIIGIAEGWKFALAFYGIAATIISLAVGIAFLVVNKIMGD